MAFGKDYLLRHFIKGAGVENTHLVASLPLNFQDIFVDAVHDRTRSAVEDDLNRERIGPEADAGRIMRTLHTSKSESIKEDAKRRTRQAFDDILYLNRLLRWIDQEIEQRREKIDVLQAEIDELEELLILLKSGKYDPANEEHRAMMEAQDLDPYMDVQDAVDHVEGEK